MARDSDVKDILSLDREAAGAALHSREVLPSGLKEPKRLKRLDARMRVRRPSGMNREVYALLYSDSKLGQATSLLPTDTGTGYRQPRARLGRRHVRPWRRMEFSNPGREDGLRLQHWRRAADEGKEYPFAQFSKSVEMPPFSDEEYAKHLTEEAWTRDETDHLLQLCVRFDLRFVVIQDRYDTVRFPKRSIEDLKLRYYSICNRLKKARSPAVELESLVAYDALHETKRKLQLERLLNRTRQQVEEEELLAAELRKIEVRKKERLRKQHDLQKLISQAEHNTESRKSSVGKKSSSSSKKTKSLGTPSQLRGEATAVFKSYDKSSGVSLRTSKMKTPMTLGQKKAKAIEQLLEELGTGGRPMPTEQICVQYNELRNDILLLLDLKAACDACDFELQSLRHRYEALPTPQQAKVALPEVACHTPKRPLASGVQLLDVVSSSSGGSRKRRLATLESAVKKSRRS